MSRTKSCFIICLSLSLLWCEAYKILVVFPFAGRSHAILGDGIVRHLLKAGHEVTYMSPFTYKPSSPNLRMVDLSRNLDLFPSHMMNFEKFLKKESDFRNIARFTTMTQNMQNLTISNENVQKLLSDPNEHFDLVIAEWLFSDVFTGFAAVFDCPFVWSSSHDSHWNILRLIDEPTNPAYTADIMSLNSLPFTFWQRWTELYTQIKHQYYRYMYINDMERNIYENLLAPLIIKRGRQPPSYYDIQFNTSLVLANSHVSLGHAISVPQSFKPIGGYHIDGDVKPLPEDLKKLMDNAKEGVIYFSMGSNMKSKDMPKALKDDLLKVFGGLKQTILWKFEEDLPNKPKNVNILNWAPQQSILAHPNIVVFITHGGLLSTTETIHFGVPIIAIPLFGDQFINTARAVKKGFACEVELSYELAKYLKIAIKEVIANPEYAEKAKELSFVYHDRPVTPGKEMVHWVRHVIETRGAPHLRSPALNVPLYQKLYLDLLAITLFTLVLIIKLLKCLLHVFTNVKVNSKKKNN